MNKTELAAAVADKTGLPKVKAEAAVTAMIESITEALKSGDKVSLVGFGTFEVRERAARDGVNPQTREKIKIAATVCPAFKAGKTLKDEISGSSDQ